MFAASSTPVPASSAAVQPTLAEQLTTFGQNAWRNLMQLDAREAGINFLLSAGVVLAALVLTWALRHLLDRWLGGLAQSCDPDNGQAGTGATPRVAGVTWALLRLTILVGAVLWVMSVWGIDPWAWLTGEAGARIVRLVLIVVMVTALVEVAGFIIRRVIESFAGRSRDSRRAAQLRTLGPLLTGSAQGVLLVIGLLTFLSELGVKVGPLMASAGVVGIAVGFGAQTIVKDFLTGLFLIAEDVVSVGDNVRIGDASGTVEAMTLRTIRLRNMNGTLHIFPYSEAQVIHNRTKVFSSYVFEIVVAYSTDLDQALATMARVGRELEQEEAFKALITRPFEVLGVDKLGENGVTLKARVTTQPRAQWKVGREYNRRVALAFEAAGVSTPFTTVQLMPQDEPADRYAPEEPRSFAAPAGSRPS
jgi:small conductance mechanosensitive channel